MLSHELSMTDMAFTGMDSLAAVDHNQLEKVVLAQKVGQFLSRDHDESERSVVGNVARVLANDVSNLVRQTLAFELRQTPFVPKDVAEKIAHDIEAVAGPFLSATEIFTPEELAKLVTELEEHGQIAIARRSTVPGVVCEALADHAGERAVRYMVRNKGADMTEDACGTVIGRFDKTVDLMDRLAERSDLPVAVAEKLVEKVSEAYRTVLVEHYELDPDRAAHVVGEAKTKSFAEILENSNDEEMARYIQHLKRDGRLTPDVILVATKQGNLRFFEMALGALLNLSPESVQEIIRDKGRLGLEKLLERAEFPQGLLRHFQAALEKVRSRPGIA